MTMSLTLHQGFLIQERMWTICGRTGNFLAASIPGMPNAMFLLAQLYIASSHHYVVYILLIASLVELVSGKVQSSGPDGFAGTISYGEDMNDEGDFSEHVPDDLKCDACKLLAKKLTEKFDYIHKRRPSVRRLKESDILTVTEAVCNGPFDDYGVKEVNKVMRLSGPGLETNGLPGVTQSGGKWPHRLLKMCNGYLGELDEIEIYEKYKKYGTLETYMCYGSGVRGECSRTKNFTKGRHEL